MHKNDQQIHQINNQYDPKDKIIEEARKATKILIEQNTQLRNDLVILKLQYESLSNKDKINRQFPHKQTLPRLPDPTTPQDEQEIITQPKPLELINPQMDDIQTQMQISELAKQFGTIELQHDQPHNGQQCGETLINDTSPKFHSLAMPTNIIPDTEIRHPQNLAILREHAIMATIGNFDPDIHIKTRIDFRQTWNKILNYTKNHKLYEDEYIDILTTIMRGSASLALSKLIREHKGNLTKIILALQTLYSPQHTIYQDIEALNKFKRQPNENINSMMRRAYPLLLRVKPTCPEAAWLDRYAHLTLSLIKQVITKRTFKHLHEKELKAAQSMKQLTLHEITKIIAAYESQYDALPKQEMSLTHKLIENSETNYTDVNKVKLQINSLFPKRLKLERTIKRQKRHLDSPGALKRPHPDSSKRFNDTQSTLSSQTSNSSFKNPQCHTNNKKDSMKLSSSNSKDKPSNCSWLHHKQKSTSSKLSKRPTLSTHKWRQNQEKLKRANPEEKQTHTEITKNLRKETKNRNGHERYKSNSQGKMASFIAHGSRSHNETNTITMSFYQCKLCPRAHLKGTKCNKKQLIQS